MMPSLRHRILAVAHGYGLGDEVEDVAQDTMLKLWTIRDRLGDSCPPEAMASCIARHLCVDHLRRRRTVPLDPLTALTDGAPRPDREMETREQLLYVEQQLDRLPSTEHTVLHLRHVEGKTAEEIAAIAGISTASVAPLLSRARRHLLEQMKRSKQPSR